MKNMKQDFNVNSLLIYLLAVVISMFHTVLSEISLKTNIPLLNGII
jgi:hypothetical protein